MHQFHIRVYYEDTDAMGIVYYANYLRFTERARTEYLRAHGIDQSRMRAESGRMLAVRRLSAEYLAPARLDDVLTVATRLGAHGAARFTMHQQVLRGDAVLFAAEVEIVCISSDGRPVRFPEPLRGLLERAGT